MQNKTFIPPEKLSSKSFTLIELIVVIIIVGILAAVGISQYSLQVEKSRIAEAKIRLGNMRQLVYQYYLENGTLTGIQNSYLGVDNTCASDSYYRYQNAGNTTTLINLTATRCTSGGKAPDATRGYAYTLQFNPATGSITWYCGWSDGSSCFGLPAYYPG